MPQTKKVSFSESIVVRMDRKMLALLETAAEESGEHNVSALVRTIIRKHFETAAPKPAPAKKASKSRGR